jgi:hypothetical protein
VLVEHLASSPGRGDRRGARRSCAELWPRASLHSRAWASKNNDLYNYMRDYDPAVGKRSGTHVLDLDVLI